MQLNDIKSGDWIMADTGFTCLRSGPHKVNEDSGQPYVACDCGKHFLDGQVGEDGSLVGVYQVGAQGLEPVE